MAFVRKTANYNIKRILSKLSNFMGRIFLNVLGQSLPGRGDWIEELVFYIWRSRSLFDEIDANVTSL